MARLPEVEAVAVRKKSTRKNKGKTAVSSGGQQARTHNGWAGSPRRSGKQQIKRVAAERASMEQVIAAELRRISMDQLNQQHTAPPNNNENSSGAAGGGLARVEEVSGECVANLTFLRRSQCERLAEQQPRVTTLEPAAPSAVSASASACLPAQQAAPKEEGGKAPKKKVKKMKKAKKGSLRALRRNTWSIDDNNEREEAGKAKGGKRGRGKSGSSEATAQGVEGSFTNKVAEGLDDLIRGLDMQRGSERRMSTIGDNGVDGEESASTEEDEEDAAQELRRRKERRVQRKAKMAAMRGAAKCRSEDNFSSDEKRESTQPAPPQAKVPAPAQAQARAAPLVVDAGVHDAGATAARGTVAGARARGTAAVEEEDTEQLWGGAGAAEASKAVAVAGDGGLSPRSRLSTS